MSRYFDEHYSSSAQSLLDDTPNQDEIWQPLKNYPGYYICKEGFVINEKGRVLPEHRGDRRGHINIRLRLNKKQKEEYLHRLLAKQYIPNPNNLPLVRHLDDDPSNNELQNLAWGTPKDNHNDCVSNGNYKPFTDEMREKHLINQRTPVIAKDIKTGKTRLFKSQAEAAKSTGTHQANIYKVLKGQRVSTCGYSFEYAKKGDK